MLFVLLLFVTSIYSQKIVDLRKVDITTTVEVVNTDGIEWYSPKEKPFRLLGFKWIKEDTIYRRLPLKANFIIPKKASYRADQTSGGQIQFKTNSKRILIRVKLIPSRHKYHMTQVAKQGFDIYVGNPSDKLFTGSSKFDYNATEYTSKLYYNSSRDLKEYTINFPLYNGVESVEIGLDKNAQLQAPSLLDSKKSIVIYGTSITQGSCASRPGMTYTNILSRKLNMEVVNLGFGGAGKGEPEIAKLITQIDDKGLIILDFEANTHEELRKLLEPFILILRKKEKTPILVISRISLVRDQNPSNLKKRISLMNFQKSLVAQFQSNGDKNIYFLDGSTLLRKEWLNEATVDGTHPTDLGFLMMAESIEPHIRSILNK